MRRRRAGAAPQVSESPTRIHPGRAAPAVPEQLHLLKREGDLGARSCCPGNGAAPVGQMRAGRPSPGLCEGCGESTLRPRGPAGRFLPASAGTGEGAGEEEGSAGAECEVSRGRI